MNLFRRKRALAESPPVPTDAAGSPDLAETDEHTDPVRTTSEPEFVLKSVRARLATVSEPRPDPVGGLGISNDDVATHLVDIVSDPKDDAPSPAGSSDGAPFVARERLTGQDTSAPSRRRIWDIEAESARSPNADIALPSPPPEDVPAADPLPASLPGVPLAADTTDQADHAENVALAREQIARFTRAGLSPSQPAPTAVARAKTRVLGFQSAALANRDPFASGAEEKAQPVTRFPVGWIVVTAGPGRGACFTLSNGVSSIGRGADQAVCLDFGDGSISRNNHASIAYDDEMNRFFLGQGGKSNIVRLNDRPVLSTEDIADGDSIRIGETTLRFVALCGERFHWKKSEQAEDGDDAGIH